MKKILAGIATLLMGFALAAPLGHAGPLPPPTWILVGEDDIESKRYPFLWAEGAELVWGPPGSWFAVIKGWDPGGGAMEYTALDIRGVREIRSERVPSLGTVIVPSPNR